MTSPEPLEVEADSPEPYYTDESVTVYAGDCLDVMADLADATIDAVITDPPYGLEFMGKDCDSFQNNQPQQRGLGVDDMPHDQFIVFEQGGTSERRFKQRQEASRAYGDWCTAWAIECLRILKPGGHLLAFGGTRTHHRLACAIEDAGFEIRDSIAWLYGSGFPKSLNLPGGLGTALKPAHEPIAVARKPLRGTVAANVQEFGTGAINIDACRVQYEAADMEARRGRTGSHAGEAYGHTGSVRYSGGEVAPVNPAGRWPTNVVLDESQAAELDAQTGTLKSGKAAPNGHKRSQPPGEGIYGGGRGLWSEAGDAGTLYGDSGGASRFFPTFRYEPKASASERPAYKRYGTAADTYGTRKRCTQCGKQEVNSRPTSQCQCPTPDFAPDPSQQGVISHPTVKPLDLMRWLVRLVTPPNGIVLDPFAGSGTTAEACIHEYKRCIAIEREPDYLPLILARLRKPMEVGFDFEEPA